MRLDVKEIKEHKDGAYGKYWNTSRRRACITISRKANTTVNWYALTLIHELLHFWVAMITIKGAKVDRRKEHRFIQKLEVQVIKALDAMKTKGGW